MVSNSVALYKCIFRYLAGATEVLVWERQSHDNVMADREPNQDASVEQRRAMLAGW